MSRNIVLRVVGVFCLVAGLGTLVWIGMSADSDVEEELRKPAELRANHHRLDLDRPCLFLESVFPAVRSGERWNQHNTQITHITLVKGDDVLSVSANSVSALNSVDVGGRYSLLIGTPPATAEDAYATAMEFARLVGIDGDRIVKWYQDGRTRPLPENALDAVDAGTFRHEININKAFDPDKPWWVGYCIYFSCDLDAEH